MASSRSTLGFFRVRSQDPSEVTFASFENPWDFYSLFFEKDSIWIQWLMKEGLLANDQQIKCQSIIDEEQQMICGRPCNLQKRSKKIDGFVWRCQDNHETSIRHGSFFASSKHAIPDVMVFLKNFLDSMSLRKCASFSNIAYKSTAVYWGQYVRDLFVQYVWEDVIQQPEKLSGVVEVDESLFGKRYKYHRGHVKSQINIWIVGLVERGSGKQIMYPVDKRDSGTLLKIITRHVERGSTVYTDGWVGYRELNNNGYRHFSVIHKDGFKKIYKDMSTGEEITEEVHTNTVEGSWQVAKEHFKMAHGVELTTFEQHLAEIIWRNHHKGSPGDVYEAFFNLVKYIYNHEGPPRLNAPRPLFDTWRGDLAEGESVKIHPMFDTSAAIISSPAQIRESALHDHGYSASDGDSGSTVDPGPAMSAAAGPSIVPADPNLPSPTAGPSTSDRGFRHVFCPAGYVAAKESSSSESIHQEAPSTSKNVASPFSSSDEEAQQVSVKPKEAKETKEKEQKSKVLQKFARALPAV